MDPLGAIVSSILVSPQTMGSECGCGSAFVVGAEGSQTLELNSIPPANQISFSEGTAGASSWWWSEQSGPVPAHSTDSTTTTALAPPLDENHRTRQQASGSTVVATPGHYMIASHAVALGTWTATQKAFEEPGLDWAKQVKMDSCTAAGAISPLSSHLLHSQVFGDSGRDLVYF
mmetsp:Transcript_13866/g.21626  ORF Transcript_13866/g.21626 Transcript_13866/m.21626 type:complete len:174 (-) Transcript_13866:105-626(-)|eukprot:CAMPEP_0184312916 /NCGR_PEP_ID=MMETSP1049-20130417/56649_1 /TAXON_ID=77928 /ORGANISM="Proteomonas sulcata, Strain CCMP704" /LENGTH=173 /DNA_ID=CAMNT_0026629603 /DNA_START=70 /DNA_END=591 /DNA_ORIENTATION=-